MKTRKVLVAHVALLVVASLAHASVVSVKNMSFGGYSSLNYFSAGAFSIAKTSGYVDVKLYGATSYDYKITTQSLSFSSSALTGDNSASGVASGTFSGTSILTVTGTITNKLTGVALATGTLLTATMVPSSWQLNEVLTNVLASGNIAFTPTGGLLVTGVTDGANIIEIGNFALAMSLKTSGVADFQGTSYSAIPPTIQINAAEVPEPVTLTLLGLGGALFFRRKN